MTLKCKEEKLIISRNFLFSVSNLFIRIVVAYSHTLIKISNIVGWAYFVAWSASFYPQIVSNFQRKSVVGLSFDFTSLNLVGFTLYSIFNAGLYWNSYIKVNWDICQNYTDMSFVGTAR